MKPKTILTSLVIASLVILIVGCSSASSCTDVPINMSDMQALQNEVDQGHTVGKIDAEQVTREFLSVNLQIPADQVETVEPVSGSSSESKAEYLVTLTDGTKYEIYLTKPVRQDPTGIWAVEKYCKK